MWQHPSEHDTLTQCSFDVGMSAKPCHSHFHSREQRLSLCQSTSLSPWSLSEWRACSAAPDVAVIVFSGPRLDYSLHDIGLSI